MAPQVRRSGASLAEALIHEPYRFDFFEAVRILEQLHPDRAPVGSGASPSDEPLRFRAHDELGFPPSDIVTVEGPPEDRPVEMSVSFMSLAGPHGPLPAPYAELIQDQARAGNTALRDFLDLLVHRLIALRYRGRKRHHVGLESGAPGESPVARYLRAIGGLGTEAAQGRLSVSDDTLLRYASLLNQNPSSAHGLSVMLGDYFDAAVNVSPLTGRWIDLDPHQHTRIGVSGQNQALGESTVLGDRAWDQQAGLTVEVGVSAFNEYLDFLPKGRAHRELVDLSTLYLGRTTGLDIALTLDAEETPSATLGTLLGARLGEDAWMGTPPGDTVTQRVQPDTFTPEQEVLRIPLFAQLSPSRLQEVIDLLPRREVDADQHVARQGQPADAFYVLAEGEANVRYRSPGSDEPTVLATLEPGGVFGDEAMLAGENYESSLVTTRSTHVLVVRPDPLGTLADQFPAIERALEVEYSGEGLVSEEDEDQEIAPQTGLGALFATKMWGPFRDAGTVRTVEPDAQAFDADTIPDALQILFEGAVRIGVDTLLDVPGTPLNLDALVEGRPSAAPGRATQRTTVLTIGREALRRLLRKHAAIERALRTWYTSSR